MEIVKGGGGDGLKNLLGMLDENGFHIKLINIFSCTMLTPHIFVMVMSEAQMLSK
jgi:hypothetical protein